MFLRLTEKWSWLRVAGVLLCVLVLSVFESAAQEQAGGLITGRLTDAETGEPLASANVYLSYTTIGTTTSEAGTFRIGNLSAGVFDLVASLIGYERRVISVRIAGPDSAFYEIALSARVLQTDPVEVVSSPPEEWMENLERFKKAFIGESANAEQCRILNPEVLNFQSDSNSHYLIAGSDSIVRIENLALGYTISFILAKFSWDLDRDAGEYLIYPKFESLASLDPKRIAAWEQSRLECFDGSLQHFLRSLDLDAAGDADFRVYAGKRAKLMAGEGHIVNPGELIAREDDASPFKQLSFSGDIRVEYRHYFKECTSFLRLREKTALIDSLGNLVNPLSVEVSGSWAKNRISDLLPRQ